MENFEHVPAPLHHALVDAWAGIGLAIGATLPPDHTADDLLELWDSRDELDDELAVLGLGVVDLRPDGLLLLGRVPELYDEHGLGVSPWGPDSLPVYAAGAAEAREHRGLPDLEGAMFGLLAELEGAGQ